MYKCKECGTEYKIKPDFCDCGNDTFDTIEETSDYVKQEEKSQISANISNSTKQDIKNVYQNSKNNFSQASINSKKSFSEQYPSISRFFSTLDPISVVIFAFCLILSLIIILIPVKETSDADKSNVQQEKQITNNIPSLDSFWNSTPPQKKDETKPLPKAESPNVMDNVVKNIPVTKTVTTPTKKQLTNKQTNVQKTTPNIVQQKTVTKSATQKQTTAVPQKNIQNSKPSTSVKKVETKTTAPSKAVTNIAPQTQPKTVSNQTKTVDPAVIAAQQAKNITEAKLELDNYKYSLRNVIGRKIDFSKVIGDGNCTVSFKISSSGQLINRTFIKQSDNITLNDAVYKAVMATPSYNPPPSAYKSETLKLSIKIYNGNFEVSLN